MATIREPAPEKSETIAGYFVERLAMPIAAVSAFMAAAPDLADAEPATCAVGVAVEEEVVTAGFSVTVEPETAIGTFHREGAAPSCRLLFDAGDAPAFEGVGTGDSLIAVARFREPLTLQGPIFECDFYADTDDGLPAAGDFAIARATPVASYSIGSIACTVDPESTTTTLRGTTTTSSTPTSTTRTTVTTPPSEGACCFGGARCAVITPDQCVRGDYLGDGITCDACLQSVTTTTTDVSNPRCGQPVSDGADPTAADCLFILRVAVGSETCVPACICDVSGDSLHTATDALACLNIAVGIAQPLACSCSGTTSTTATIPTTTSTTTTSMTTTTTVPAGEGTGVCCRRGCTIVSREQCDGFYRGDSEQTSCSAADEAFCAACAAAGCPLPAPTPSTLSTTTTSRATSTTLATTTTLGADTTGACCEDGKCSIAAPEDCSGRYLGDRDDPVCAPTDVALCVRVRRGSSIGLKN